MCPFSTRPMICGASADRIYVIPAPCHIGCETMPHNDDCVTRHALEIVEARYLEDQLARGSVISRCFGIPNLEAAPYNPRHRLGCIPQPQGHHARRPINVASLGQERRRDHDRDRAGMRRRALARRRRPHGFGWAPHRADAPHRRRPLTAKGAALAPRVTPCPAQEKEPAPEELASPSA